MSNMPQSQDKLALNEWSKRGQQTIQQLGAGSIWHLWGAQLVIASIVCTPACMHACQESASTKWGAGRRSGHGGQNWAGRGAAMCRFGSFAVHLVAAGAAALRLLHPWCCCPGCCRRRWCSSASPCCTAASTAAAAAAAACSSSSTCLTAEMSSCGPSASASSSAGLGIGKRVKQLSSRGLVSSRGCPA